MAVITKVYDNYGEARRALNSVEALSLPGVEASLLGNESVDEFRAVSGRDRDVLADDRPVTDSASGTATGAGVGAAVGGGAGLLAGLGMLAIPGIGPLVAAGWLAATAVGAAGGALAGGAIGALTDIGVTKDDEPVFHEAMRRGGVAVSVRFPEESRLAVESALGEVSAASYPDLRRRYEAEGWRHDETEAEREARLRDRLPPGPML